MLTLASPLWLLALPALLLVWWLHRFHELQGTYPVAALFLWPKQEAPGRERRKSLHTDPIWLLRALVAGLLILALCEPHWSRPTKVPLIVWVDDSPSMFTLDGDTTRMEQALLVLDRQLSTNPFITLTLHSLAMPGETLVLDPMAGPGRMAAMRTWAASPRGEPRLPAPALIASDSAHWLLSDGASGGIADWLRLAPVDRVITVGSSRENVGITGLALRRGNGDERRGQLLVSVSNGGKESATRELELFVDGRQLPPLLLRIDPGAEQRQLVGLEETPDSSLRAGISPGDALPLDDALEIPAAQLKRASVAISGDCNSPLRAALAAHPALAPTSDAAAAADLRVHCGPVATDLQGPALRLTTRPASPIEGAVYWHPSSGKLRGLSLSPAWLAAPSQIPDPGDGLVLLDSARQPLLVWDTRRNIIDSQLNMVSGELPGQPEYPLLVAGLIDLLLGETPTGGDLVIATRRGPVSVEPHPLALSPTAQSTTSTLQTRDLTAAVIIAAALALLLDLLVLGRRLMYQLRHGGEE